MSQRVFPALIASLICVLSSSCTADTGALATANATPASAHAHPLVTPPGSGGVTHIDGLIQLAAVKALPAHDTSPSAGYPGRGFHFGAMKTQRDWQTFATAAGITSPLAIDWSKQMVVYLVLDAQTNQLLFERVSIDPTGNATLQFRWIGIEPYYRSQTPAVMAVVDRAGITKLTFQAVNARRAIGVVPVS